LESGGQIGAWEMTTSKENEAGGVCLEKCGDVIVKKKRV